MEKRNIEDCLWYKGAIWELEEHGFEAAGYKEKGCYDCATPCGCYVHAGKPNYLAKVNDSLEQFRGYLKTPLNEIP